MAPRRSARIRKPPASTVVAPASTTMTATPNSKKKRKAAPKQKATASKQKRRGPRQKITATAPSVVADPERKLQGTIVELDDQTCDVMLVLVDPAKNHDKYYVLQLIEDVTGVYRVCTRWGRTGTAGQCLVKDFKAQEEAEKCFSDKFLEKTGLLWEKRSEPSVGGKYRWVEQDYAAKQAGFTNAVWQYWVDDGVDGKETGWYNYTPEGSSQVEQLFSESALNSNLTERFVVSGVWTYRVDLRQMIQTNVTHANHTSRRIRRCPVDEEMDDEPPQPIAITSSATIIPAPVSSSSVSSSAVSSVSVPPTPVNSSNTGSHPVDPDIRLHGSSASNYCVVQSAETDKWYDAVLNQCNITGSSNNNKYYRIQMVTDPANAYWVWLKWGRVGEPATSSASDLKGPFATEEAALMVFAKKFKDKTGNGWDADDFVPKKGKYTLIEIDNDVTTAHLVTPIKTEQEDIEYLPSKLDPKTKELVEVLFSKEMRDSALLDFNLDLKRLPLGVPSQTQIQQGIDILEKIKSKLNGGVVADSYNELSSRFYTAIPHSFGRSRPPPISTKESLQSRFDMCDILMDMYSTNETIRKLEEQTKPKTQVPYPADAHYDSLKADLELVSPTTKDYKMIKTYFDKTKSHSNAQLFNIWKVNREGEADRYRAFDSLDNRKLLWHGTNIAVVAAILTNGLRIMPHSGGRVGSGIYLASMQEKSAQYTSGHGAKFACMFLCETALGKSYEVTQDGYHASSLKAAPKGFHSVHALGTTQPKRWETFELDRKKVLVPQSQGSSSKIVSTFGHDEFLVYKEAQVRLRYVLTVKLY